MDFLECETASRPYLLGTHIEKGITVLYRPDCKLWSCPHCANVKAKQWSARVRQVIKKSNSDPDDMDAWHFLTITIKESTGMLDNQIRIFRTAWDVFSKRLRRACPHALEYVLIPELSPVKKRLHAHMLLNWYCEREFKMRSRMDAERGKVWYYYSRWLHDNLHTSGLGYQYDVQPLATPEQASSYVSKYIGKGLSEVFPPGFRRVRTSQGFPRTPKEDYESGFIWEILLNNSRGARALVAVLLTGEIVTDLETKKRVNMTHGLITGKNWSFEKI